MLKKIVKGQPYPCKDELVQKKVISQVTYDTIKDMAMANQR